jgi:ferric-dicitrate binding protein FerR (iron transport regulator)
MDDPSDLPPTAISWQILDRYIAGESPPSERAEVERWIAADASRAQMVSALRSGGVDASWNTDSAWTQLSGRMAETRFSPAARAPSLWRAPTRALRVAAAVVLLTGAAAAAGYLLSGDRSSVAAVLAMREDSTARGERREVVLPDGSRVTLAAQSRLRYPVRFEGAARDVELIGEAYFSVTPDIAHPFSVHAPGAVARVLGTEFNVRAYPGADETEIIVASGRVLVRPPHDSTAAGAVLTAGQLARVRNGADAVSVERDVVVDRYLAWKTGRLRFSARPLREVLAELERWFDVELTVQDAGLSASTVTTDVRIDAGVSANDAVDAIAVALGARVERRGRTIVLLPNPRIRQ